MPKGSGKGKVLVYGRLVQNDLAAFELFFTTRSYKRVAETYGVTDNAVYKHAEKMDWPLKIEERVKRLRSEIEGRLAQRIIQDTERQYDILTMGEYHAGNVLKSVDVATGKHIKPFDLKMTMDAMETLVKTKRLIMGKSTENKAVSVTDLTLMLHGKAGEI